MSRPKSRTKLTVADHRRTPVSHVGFGERAARFAMVIDDLKVSYIGIESGGGVSVSGADAVLAKL